MGSKKAPVRGAGSMKTKAAVKQNQNSELRRGNGRPKERVRESKEIHDGPEAEINALKAQNRRLKVYNNKLREAYLTKESCQEPDEIKELKRENTRLKEKMKQAGERNRQLTEENAAMRKLLQEALPEVLLNRQRQLYEIRLCRPYEQYFDSHALCLQMLAGAARNADTFLQDQKMEDLREEAVRPLLLSVRKMNGILEDAKLVFPGFCEAFKEQEIIEKIRKESLDALAKYKREDEVQIRQGKISFQKKTAVQGLGRIIKELEKIESGYLPDRQWMERTAGEMIQILEAGGIYPMFADDGRLARQPKLQERFFVPAQDAVIYPGLFIQRDGVWEVLGPYIGTVCG